MLSINRSIIFAEGIDDQAEKKEFYISSGACSLNLFMKFVYNNIKNYIPGMDCNRTLIPITPLKKRDEKNFQARIYRKKDFFH